MYVTNLIIFVTLFHSIRQEKIKKKQEDRCTKRNTEEKANARPSYETANVQLVGRNVAAKPTTYDDQKVMGGMAITATKLCASFKLYPHSLSFGYVIMQQALLYRLAVPPARFASSLQKSFLFHLRCAQRFSNSIQNTCCAYKYRRFQTFIFVNVHCLPRVSEYLDISL